MVTLTVLFAYKHIHVKCKLCLVASWEIVDEIYHPSSYLIKYETLNFATKIFHSVVEAAFPLYSKGLVNNLQISLQNVTNNQF